MRRLFRRQSQENIFEDFDMEQHVGKELVGVTTVNGNYCTAGIKK